jgi:hypothetical protein
MGAPTITSTGSPVGHLAVTHHEDRRLAGLDQRGELAVLRDDLVVLDGEVPALLLDGGEQLGVVERRLDGPRQQLGELQIGLAVDLPLGRPQVEGADHHVLHPERHDKHRDVVLPVHPNPLRPLVSLDAQRPARADRLAGEPLVDGEPPVHRDEPAVQLVVQGVDRVLGAVGRDQHHAGPAELNHPLELEDGGAEDLAEIEGAIDERGELTDHREPLRIGPRARSAVRAHLDSPSTSRRYA